MIHQPIWPAAASVAGEPALATATALMIAIPARRRSGGLVEATAAATPACAGGMPETAVFVIGGLTESAIPNTT